MKSFKIFDRRVGFAFSAFMMLVAVISPGVFTSKVAAAQLTARSITLSSSAAAATNVTYDIKFTTSAASGAYIVDFCSDSPLVGATCTAPTGFDLTAGVGSTTSGATASKVAANTLKVVQTMSAGANETVVTGVTNPTSAGALYARIYTYADSTAANGHTSATVLGSKIDDGSVAMSITNKIAVQAAVLETLTFCVAGGTTYITANCADASTHLPNLVLGEATGSVYALSATALSTGHIYTQISTNPASGAVVNMKSSATGCGGLVRVGGAGGNCDIGPSASTGFTAGTAKFGVKTSTATANGTSGATGTFQPASGSSYGSTNYFMNYVAGEATGVTSPYGDPFLDTNNAPINNMNMDLTFGASISNNTPAGLYKADINLIATGKF